MRTKNTGRFVIGAEETRRGRLSRRQVLARAANAAVAPLFIPAAVLGRTPGSVPPSERIQLGHIGVGRKGSGHLKAALSLETARVAAICDVRGPILDAAMKVVAASDGEQAASAARCKDFRELLTRDDIDALVIATPDHWHTPMAVAAAKAGKDMYCEKPLGCSVAESKAIRDAVTQHGCIFQTGTQQRSTPTFRRASELALNGYLGELKRIEVAVPGSSYHAHHDEPVLPQPVPKWLDWEMWLGPAPRKPFNEARIGWDWYLIWDTCAGFTTNWGVHHLDIAHWGCPEIGRKPADLEFSCTYRDHGLTDNVNSWRGEFRYASGLVLGFADTGQEYEQGCRFIGDEGWVHVNRKEIKAEPESLLSVELKSSDQRLPVSQGDRPGVQRGGAHVLDFLQSVRTRQQPVAPVEAGHTASCLGMVAEISGRLKLPLRWDPKQNQFVGENAEPANARLRRPMRKPWTV